MRIVSDDALFDTFHTVLTNIIDLVGTEDVDDDKVVAADNELFANSLDVDEIAQRVGMDPVTIIALVMAIAKFIRWFRARREG